jgi:hypothetical protein
MVLALVLQSVLFVELWKSKSAQWIQLWSDCLGQGKDCPPEINTLQYNEKAMLQQKYLH